MFGETVQMSTNRTGAKTFLRAGPAPWRSVVVLSGDDIDSGAAVRVRFDDYGDEATLTLPAADAERLVEACGGEAAAIGARIKYRVHPNDTFEFRQIGSVSEAA